MTAFPEVASARDDADAARWSVRPGTTRRGGAWCDPSLRELVVPLGDGAAARAVRAHELLHARVSPVAPVDVADAHPRALACAEELRVNTLLGRLGLGVEHLADGTERDSGRALAREGDWAEAVCFLLAVTGTSAEAPFLAGVRAVSAPWAGALRAVRKRALEVMAAPTERLASTGPGEDGAPRGYRHTVTLARVATAAMAARVPRGRAELAAFARGLSAGGRRPATGQFAPLALAETELAPGPAARLRRTRRAATTGAHLRYPGRLLTDPRRRAFAGAARAGGGVVVIDQSGSMDLAAGDLEALLACAPDAFVVGYSHRPGDLGATPNCWVLADRGAVARAWPGGNVGNGVDGPALEFALSRRRGREPVVWVTDGQVTDSHDHPDPGLARACAGLVRAHGVRLARGLDEIGPALRSGALTGDPGRFGRLGRALGAVTDPP